MTKQSPDTRALCAEYYPRECRGCPIMEACHTPVLPLTRRSLAAYTARLNAAAKAAKAASSL